MRLNLATILRQAARTYHDRTALAIGSTELNYSTVDALARSFAGGLKKLGIDQGENVALMLPNVPHFTVSYYGGHYAGNPIVPLNVLLTADEIAYHLDDSDAAALVVWEGFFEQAFAGFNRVDTCRKIIIVKADQSDMSAPEGAENFVAVVAGAEPVTELAFTMPDDTAVILYTSGTTGRPKGAELTHYNMFSNAECAGTKLGNWGLEDVALCALPLFHSFGQTVLQNGVLNVGGKIVLQPRFEPKEAMQLIQDHKVTVFAGVPTMYFALLHHPESSNYDLSSLQNCLSGGSAMPVEVMSAFDEKYGVNILEGYGLSETSPVASFNMPDRPKKSGSIGIPVTNVEFRLVDNDNKTIVDVDVPGEICIKGPNVMKGYYKRPEANRQSLTNGWFHSGDIATRDADGFYFIVDRKKDMIIRGGYNVYPREIEECLYAHPAVAEAAVVGVPHESHGEEIKAFIAVKPGKTADEAELIAYCKEHLAAYKYPRSVEFMEALPKGPTGKILKRELRS